MAEEQEVRVDVVNGDEFFADEVSVSHSPIRFVIDFKSMTPRMDLPDHPPRMVIKHNLVLLDPYFAKDVLNVLKDNIEKYEKKFGEVRKPEALNKHEGEVRKAGKKPKASKQDYFG